MNGIQVRCNGCAKQYMHSAMDRMVCPHCGDRDYTPIATQPKPKTEQLTEQRNPRLLTEDM